MERFWSGRSDRRLVNGVAAVWPAEWPLIGHVGGVLASQRPS